MSAGDDDGTGPRGGEFRDVRRIVAESKDKRRAGRAHVYALEIPFSVIVGAVLGKAIDDHFGIAPWGIALGLVGGIGAAARAVYALIAWQKANDVADEADEAAGKAAAAREAPTRLE